MTVYGLFDLKLSGEVVYSGEVEVLANSISAGFIFEVRFSSSSCSLCLCLEGQSVHLCLDDLTLVIVPVRLLKLRSFYDSN